MTDIRLVFDNTLGTCDWVLTDGDLDVTGDLETAVLFSLFTDARAPDGTVTPDGTTDLRGAWIDAEEGWSMGSLLWTIMGARKVGNSLLATARSICQSALQWMVDDGIVGSVAVATSWLNGSTLNIAVTLTRPDGDDLTFQYAWAWKDQNALSTADPF